MTWEKRPKDPGTAADINEVIQPSPLAGDEYGPESAAPQRLAGTAETMTQWLDDLRQVMTFDEEIPVPLELVLPFDEQRSIGRQAAPRGAQVIEDLVWRGNHDVLTLAANRSWFAVVAERSRSAVHNRGHCHLLITLDLDGFKLINDTWGHEVGDTVLVTVADRLMKLCAPGDAVGRMGGDEFALWVERVRKCEVAGVARRFQSVFDEPVVHGQLEISVSGSLGVAVVSDERLIDDLLRSCDAALYEAKKKGPGAFCVFDELMEARQLETMNREREVRSAISDGEFDFDVQPIVDLTSGHPVGFEMLARWNNPRRGRLLPSEFLPELESMNLFRAFDAMVIDKSAASLAVWRNAVRAPRSLWVNVSPAQLEASFPDFIAGVIETLKLSAGELVLELTEDVSANTPGRIAVLDAVRSLGVKIAIDDFGAGYSQLAYLQDMPFDYIKLDRSFIAAFHSEPHRVAIAESMILLAQAVGAQVVAEGVERQEELDLLIEMGCDYAQGYLLSRPGAPEDHFRL